MRSRHVPDVPGLNLQLLRVRGRLLVDHDNGHNLRQYAHYCPRA